MKVAIDSGALSSGHKIRGIGAYTSCLIDALKKQKNEDIEIDAVDFEKTNLGKYDIAHYTFFNPFFRSFKLIPGVKTVVTIHDLIPLIYPDRYPPGFKGKIRLQTQKLLLGGVAAIITDSEASKKDICRLLNVKPDKVHVVYLAPKEIYKKITDKSVLKKVKDKYRLPDKFVLYVGDVNYNKNITNLIRACGIAKIPLVISGKQALDIEDLGNDLRALAGPRDWIRYLFGKPHPQLAHYKDLLRAIEENKNVIRLGFASDADLAAVYNLATLYCQPSLYEGFGLPVLEAVASGCPIVCSRTQVLAEIAGKAATYVDPKSPEDMAKGFKHLVKNPKLPREYSWTKTGSDTIAVYKKII